MTEHWFWLILSAACVVWYSTVTVYVGVKGFLDIRSMLDRLKSQAGSEGNGPGAQGQPR